MAGSTAKKKFMIRKMAFLIFMFLFLQYITIKISVDFLRRESLLPQK